VGRSRAQAAFSILRMAVVFVSTASSNDAGVRSIPLGLLAGDVDPAGAIVRTVRVAAHR